MTDLPDLKFLYLIIIYLNIIGLINIFFNIFLGFFDPYFSYFFYFIAYALLLLTLLIKHFYFFDLKKY